MIKMVIADDEQRTIEGISSSLDWAALDIEIVGTARNGLQALELIRAVNPDVLLTDIKMPKMDGIQLSMALREEFPHLKIIFITGYSDLNYIKSAFKYDVIDYILKPVDPGELEAVILKTVDTCHLEARMEQKQQELEDKIHQSLPLLQEKFFALLISGDIVNRREILERMAFLEINLPENGIYMAFTLDIDDYYLLHETSSVLEKQLLAFSILNVVSEVISSCAIGISFEYHESEFVGIIGFPADTEAFQIEDQIEKIFSEIKDNLNKYLKISVTIGVGEWVDSIEKVAYSYQRAAFAVKQKLLFGKNQVIYVDMTRQEAGKNMDQDDREMDHIYIALRLGSYEQAESVISQIFDHFRCCKATDREYIHMVCLQLISIINRAITEFCENERDESLNIYHLVNHLFKLETLEDLEDFFRTVCRKTCDKIGNVQRYSSKKVISDIKSIIFQNYHEDISINSLARDVYLTPSYICLLFKQETGETINSFLTKVRMEKAKELLVGKQFKLYEVSRKVGYSDPKHFSKIFKKYTGVNPSEYQ